MKASPFTLDNNDDDDDDDDDDVLRSWLNTSSIIFKTITNNNVFIQIGEVINQNQ